MSERFQHYSITSKIFIDKDAVSNGTPRDMEMISKRYTKSKLFIAQKLFTI